MFTANLEPNQKKTLIRLCLYAVALSITAIIATVLVFVARGYDIDRDTGKVIQNGLVLVESEPVSAEVFIDGVSQDDSTPSRLPLPQGQYTVELSQEGFSTWSKTFSIAGSAVRWLNYPILIADELRSAPVTVPELGQYEDIQLSRDRQSLFVQAQNQSFLVYELEDIEQPPIALDITRDILDITDPEVEPGDIRLVDTSPNGKWAIITHDHPERDRPEHIVFVVQDPQEFTNLTSEFRKNIISLSHVDNDFKEFILIDSNNEASLYNREEQELEQIQLQNDIELISSLEDEIVYVRTDDDSSQLIGREDSSSEDVVIFNFNPDMDIDQFELMQYENTTYAVALQGERALIFEDPTDQQTTPTAPFKTIVLPERASEIRVESSTRGRFVSFFGDDAAVTYDIDEDEIFRFNVDASHGTFEYIDNFRFAATDSRGVLRIMEFDGSNPSVLIDDIEDARHYFTVALQDIITIQDPQSEGEVPTVLLTELLP